MHICATARYSAIVQLYTTYCVDDSSYNTRWLYTLFYIGGKNVLSMWYAQCRLTCMRDKGKKAWYDKFAQIASLSKWLMMDFFAAGVVSMWKTRINAQISSGMGVIRNLNGTGDHMMQPEIDIRIGTWWRNFHSFTTQYVTDAKANINKLLREYRNFPIKSYPIK